MLDRPDDMMSILIVMQQIRNQMTKGFYVEHLFGYNWPWMYVGMFGGMERVENVRTVVIEAAGY